MDNNQLLILFFGIIYFGFIIYTRRKGDFEEFSVAGRSLGIFLVFASICASYIGPGMTMGLTREGYTTGWFLGTIALLAGIALMVSAFLYAPRVRGKFPNSYSHRRCNWR